MKNYFLTLLISVFIVNSLDAQEDVEEVEGEGGERE